MKIKELNRLEKVSNEVRRSKEVNRLEKMSKEDRKEE